MTKNKGFEIVIIIQRFSVRGKPQRFEELLKGGACGIILIYIYGNIIFQNLPLLRLKLNICIYSFICIYYFSVLTKNL